MNKVDKIHDDAMRLVDEADHLRRCGDKKGAERRLHQAFLQERKVAEMLASKEDFEPSRSVLHRSAATLALQCGEYREAERLIAAALAGNPPAWIADELRDLLDQVYFARPSKRQRRRWLAAKSSAS